MSYLQINDFDAELEQLQLKHGNPSICSINGAGCIDNPRLFLLFMNPTAKNVSANKNWRGLRAPWIGTKNIWKLLLKLNLIDKEQFDKTQKLKPTEWTTDFAESLYKTLANNKIYLSNLAKCTQDDARPLKNAVFREYLELTKKEVYKVSAINIVSFGVQVSEILLGKKIELKSSTEEELVIEDKKFNIYPTYYPVGQGMRNMGKAVERISALLG
ncbi:hypothetical protein KBC75_00300 [Candidatus Shapirobacteria bacterium]|nr:hypothetical protein [Candidatus Shapirobacteria bacterium]